MLLTIEGRITNLGCHDPIKVQFQMFCFIFYNLHHYVEGLPPINEPHGSHGDQFQTSAFQQQMWLGGPGPHMSEIDASIHQMRPNLGRSAFPQTRSMSDGSYIPQVANPFSSRNFEGSDSMYTDMANRSLNDSQNQIPTHLNPTYDHQVDLNPTDQMGSSAYPSPPLTSYMRSPHYNTVQQGSQINPTSVPYMNESRSDMVNRHGLTVSTDARLYKNNSSWPSSLASESTSSFSPSSISVEPNFTRKDRRVHRTNIGSFNENNNTVRDSYNDNSLADTTGRYSGHGNVLFHDIPIVN